MLGSHMSSLLMILGFLIAGVALTALGAWLMVRRWPLGVEDLLGYFGLLAPDESVAANPEETQSSRRRRRTRRRRETPAESPPVEPEGPRPRR